jgi:hypothetical protein
MAEETIFLTPEEIEVLTGYTRKAEQRRELESLGIRFLVNHTGRPVVMRAVLFEKFGTASRRSAMPNLQALEAISNGKTT